MDRFKLDSRDGEEPEIFSNCVACNEEIRIGDEYIEYYGQVSCDEYRCVLKMVDAQRKVAEDDV